MRWKGRVQPGEPGWALHAVYGSVSTEAIGRISPRGPGCIQVTFGALILLSEFLPKNLTP